MPKQKPVVILISFLVFLLGSGNVKFFNHPIHSQANKLIVDNPSYSPDGRFIVFSSWGNFDIQVLDLVSGTLTNLTSKQASKDEFPVWSYDGAKIVFLSNRSGNYDIWMMNLDGSSPINLTASFRGDEGYPTPSHVANKVAFISQPQDHNPSDGFATTLWVVDLNTLQLTQVSPENEISFENPTWSPDGNQILFQDVETDKGKFKFDLWITDLNHLTLTQLMLDNVMFPSWSPIDNSIIVLIPCDGERFSIGLFTIENTSTSIIINLTQETCLPVMSSLVWSPNGDFVAFIAELNLFVLDVKNGVIQNLLPDEHIREANWSPDGKSLIFVSLADEIELWSINVDGSNRVKLLP
jgi:Tol biopolymer transport system component